MFFSFITSRFWSQCYMLMCVWRVTTVIIIMYCDCIAMKIVMIIIRMIFWGFYIDRMTVVVGQTWDYDHIKQCEISCNPFTVGFCIRFSHSQKRSDFSGYGVRICPMIYCMCCKRWLSSLGRPLPGEGVQIGPHPMVGYQGCINSAPPSPPPPPRSQPRAIKGSLFPSLQ